MSLVLYTILILYLILIFFLIYGFDKVVEFQPTKNTTSTQFSIIIPFRNEEQNLPKLLDSLLELSYPKDAFEVWFVNDASSDNSTSIIRSRLKNSDLSFHVVQNKRVSHSPKKDAILTAISQAKFDWILTTDADCILPKLWLQTLSEFNEKHSCQMIVAPVLYKSTGNSFLEHFQVLDFLSLQGATLGGFGIEQPFLCNGANLAYKKASFLELNGFQGNDQIASGDDIFLFEKFLKAFPDKVRFLKSTSAMVNTFPLNSWKEVVQQRMRWAAKSSAYRLWFSKFVGLVVFAMNLAFLLSYGLLFLGRTYAETFLIVFILKTGVDFLLIQKTLHYYRGKRQKLKGFVLGAAFYPFFSVYVVFKTLFSSYEWKGRNFKK